MRCQDCKWFDDTVQRPGPDGGGTGLCRHDTPVVARLPGEWLWPFCRAVDWCSRFTART